jgi:hypothetical protein
MTCASIERESQTETIKTEYIMMAIGLVGCAAIVCLYWFSMA